MSIGLSSAEAMGLNSVLLGVFLSSKLLATHRMNRTFDFCLAVDKFLIRH